MKKNFLYKILFERVFDPIALYQVKNNEIIYFDINPAYEKVMKLTRNKILGKTFQQVWPNAEPRWSRVIIESLKQKKTMHCLGESLDSGSYLEAIAFPIPPEMAAVIFLDRTKLKLSDNSLKQKQNQLRILAAQITLSEENIKRSIASDIHDIIGHELVSELNLLRELKNESSQDKIKSSINQLIAKTENIISESRNLIFELSPPVLKEAGLNPAIEELAENILGANKIQWEFKKRGSADEYKIDDEICIILYRMTRELFINVLKHSKASKVIVIINRTPELITVAVEDNGKGFNDKEKKNNGFGLFSIRERLLALGGDLRIISEQNKGAMVIMSCPRKLKRGDLNDSLNNS